MKELPSLFGYTSFSSSPKMVFEHYFDDFMVKQLNSSIGKNIESLH